jgi:hypothetical protein
MARLQILELPEGTGDDRPPFVLVIDQVDDELAEDIARWPDDIAKRIGARQVLCFPGTIDIPANDTTAYLRDGSEASAQLDDYEVRTSIAADVRKANGHEDAGETDWHGILMGRRRQLTKALGISPLNDWDGILEAAEQLQCSRDGMRDAIQSVRNLHRPVEHNGQTICWECSAYDFQGLTTDNAPVAHDQCGTLRALAGEAERNQDQT